MSKPVSVDFQFSIKQRGRGAKKRIVEGASQSDESKPALERIPRISRYIALAIHFEDLIRQGVVTDYADLARLGHVTRARVTQIMNLRLLAPEIQEELLLGEKNCDDRTPIQLKSLQFIATVFSWRTQRKLWENRD
ncbi:MAG TPA: hypothetical protein DDZ51_03115 [Planctomycetaceae bacterium]|nr:hypothetical protein [Planctomycetaceae bacterium]